MECDLSELIDSAKFRVMNAYPGAQLCSDGSEYWLIGSGSQAISNTFNETWEAWLDANNKIIEHNLSAWYYQRMTYSAQRRVQDLPGSFRFLQLHYSTTQIRYIIAQNDIIITDMCETLGEAWLEAEIVKFGNPAEMARNAVKTKYPSARIAQYGNTSSWVEHTNEQERTVVLSFICDNEDDAWIDAFENL